MRKEGRRNERTNLPPFQGEGRGGDGVACIRLVCDLGPHPPPDLPLERGGKFFPSFLHSRSIPINLGRFGGRAATVFLSFNHASTTSQIGVPLVSSATGAHPATL